MLSVTGLDVTAGGHAWVMPKDFCDSFCDNEVDFLRYFCDIVAGDNGAMKTLILTASAARDLDDLPVDAREQVSDGLQHYAMTGKGDVKRLSGRDGFRLRIGRYRVLFDEDQHTILAIYIGKRETTTYRHR